MNKYKSLQAWCSCFNLPLFSVSFFLPSILFRYQYDQEIAVPTSWQEGRNSIITTVSRKTAHRRISFLIVTVSAPERHWIGFQSHFARAAHATYSVDAVRSSGRTHNWRASEASETLSGLFNWESRIYIYINTMAECLSGRKCIAVKWNISDISRVFAWRREISPTDVKYHLTTWNITYQREKSDIAPPL